MFKSMAMLCMLSGAGFVILADSHPAHAEVLFRPIVVHARLYENSLTHPVGLNDAGLLVTEEYNTFNRGYIQNFVFDSTTGLTHRLDDVVGRPSRPMPGGLIGGAKHLGVAGESALVYLYRGTAYAFQPSGPLGTAVGTTHELTPLSGVLNDEFAARSETPGLLSLRRLSAPAEVVSSVQVANVDPEHGYLNCDSINSGSRIAGAYYDGGTPRGLQTFVWEPDLTGQTSGEFHLATLRNTHRGAEITSLQSDHGNAVVFNVYDGSIQSPSLQSAYLWTHDAPPVRLNDLFSAGNLVVSDINSSGSMVGELSDADFLNRRYFLYTPESGLQAFSLDWIESLAGENWISFRPMLINDAGQIAGVAMYQQTLSNGNTIMLSKAVLLNVVPEPTGLALVGISAVAGRRRRRSIQRCIPLEVAATPGVAGPVNIS